MNLEHLNNLELFPSFTKLARSLKARLLKELGQKIEGIMATRAAEGKTLAELGNILKALLALAAKDRVAHKKEIKDLATLAAKSKRNAAMMGTGAALGGGGIGWGLNSITSPDHAASAATTKGNVNNNNKKEKTDWIDNTANSISEFYEKHPAVAWGGTTLAGLGGLYGLYNALDDEEDEDDDY